MPVSAREEASPKAEVGVFPRERRIGPLAGRVHSRGFSLSLRVDGRTYLAEIGLKGVQVERADPPGGGLLSPILWGLHIPPRLHLPVALLLALAFLGLSAYEFFNRGKGFIVVLLPLMVFLGALLRLDGAGRWHALEHKGIWVLKDNPPRDLEALREALRRASPYHPRCGSIFGTLALLFAGLLALFLPKGPAFLLALLLADRAQELNLPRPLVVALQWPFLAPPKEEELEITARGLAGLLSALEAGEGALRGSSPPKGGLDG